MSFGSSAAYNLQRLSVPFPSPPLAILYLPGNGVNSTDIPIASQDLRNGNTNTPVNTYPVRIPGGWDGYRYGVLKQDNRYTGKLPYCWSKPLSLVQKFIS
jgi:hypothetical protein